jgi:hypothetical protein
MLSINKMEQEYRYKFADHFMAEQGFIFVNGEWIKKEDWH